jgi:hypothetical protein
MIDKFVTFPSGNIRNTKSLFINVILIIDTRKDEN